MSTDADSTIDDRTADKVARFGSSNCYRALTISQPFASLIADGAKWVENRRWNCSYRGPLAIHAGKGNQYLTAQELKQYPTGAVLALVDIVACVQLQGAQGGLHDVDKMENAGIMFDQLLRHEHAEGPFCFVLQNVRKYREPIPCRGAQGLWRWSEPDCAEFAR